jgi:hypothetical protein
MTPKQNVLRFVATLPDDVTYDRIAYHLDVMRAIEQGEADIKRGAVIDHHELFDELLAEDAESQDRLERASKTRPKRNSSSHRKKRPANGNGIRPKTG